MASLVMVLTRYIPALGVRTTTMIWGQDGKLPLANLPAFRFMWMIALADSRRGIGMRMIREMFARASIRPVELNYRVSGEVTAARELIITELRSQ
jgi:hypothetical protein